MASAIRIVIAIWLNELYAHKNTCFAWLLQFDDYSVWKVQFFAIEMLENVKKKSTRKIWFARKSREHNSHKRKLCEMNARKKRRQRSVEKTENEKEKDEHTIKSAQEATVRYIKG